MAADRWEEAQQLTLVHNEKLHEQLSSDAEAYGEYCRLLEKNRRMPMIPNMEEEEDEWAPASRSAVALPEDFDAKAKAKAATLIEQLLADAEKDVAEQKRRAVPTVREPEPVPETQTLKAAPAMKAKPAPKPKAAPAVPPPITDIDDTFVAPPKDAEPEQKSAQQIKAELRKHNAEAAREAAERKARRQESAIRKKQKAAELAVKREKDHRADSSRKIEEAVKEAHHAATAAAVVLSEEEVTTNDEREASAVPKGRIPPPKVRPPKKSQKGLVPTVQKTVKDNQTAVWGVIAAITLFTLAHYMLR
jgi:hypothetical protein